MKYMFYQPIKIMADNQDVCFWSDTHFNHKCEHWPTPLWKSRGFSSVEEHNEELIQRWNKKSNINTVFFHLGDFILGYDSITHFKSIIQRLNFKELYIMPGNHTSGWKQAFEEQRGHVWNLKNKKVIFVPNYIEAHINGQLIVMSHYPILSFNGQHKSSFCIYGHVHKNLIKSDIGKLYNKAKTLEVTVDNCSSPVLLTEVHQILKNKDPISFDHHLL